MPVPNNYNFSLQDVVNEIPGGQASLAECFLEATSAQFDSAYDGSRNSLRNFRNYGAFVDTLSIAPTSLNLSTNNTTRTVTVTSNTGWFVTDNASWISTNVGPANGLGNGSFTVIISQNSTSSSRTGVVTVTTLGGLSATLTITQTGVTAQLTFPVSLGRSAQQIAACFSPVSIYYITGSNQFNQATGLYTNTNGTNRAPANYYADGNIIRFWTGNSFSGVIGLCLSGPEEPGFE